MINTLFGRYRVFILVFQHNVRKLIYFMLSMIKESSQNALERYFIKTGEDIHMSQQAFSLARQKIKWEALREIFDDTVNAFYREYREETERRNGLRVHAIDGSKQSLPNDKALREHFGTSGAGGITAWSLSREGRRYR